MAGNDYINHSYMIKHGPYKDFECTIRKVQTNPVVKIYADIQFIRKTVEIELKPEDLGLPIEVELSQYPSNIVETWINNCINHNQMKQFLNYGASEADIDSFKSKLNIEVPDCFYQFYRNFNGMRYSKLDEISDNGYFLYDQSSAILNLNDVLETKRSWDVFIRDMRLNFDQDDDGLEEYLYWYWNEKFIPYEISDYHLLVIDTSGIRTNHKNQIIYFDINEPGAKIVYPSLENYFFTLNELLIHGCLFKSDRFSKEYREICENINGKSIALYPSDILPEFDWNNNYRIRWGLR